MERTGNDGSVKKSKKRKHSSTTETKHSKSQKIAEPNRTDNSVASSSTNSGKGRTESSEVNMSQRIGNDGSVKRSKKRKHSSTTETKHSKSQKIAEPNRTDNSVASSSTNSGKGRTESSEVNMSQRIGNDGSVKRSKKRKHSSTTETKHSHCQKIAEPSRTDNAVASSSTNSGKGRTESSEVNMERTGNDGSLKRSKKAMHARLRKDKLIETLPAGHIKPRKHSSTCTTETKHSQCQKIAEPNRTDNAVASSSTNSGKGRTESSEDNKERTKLKQKSPLVYFDLETTGLKPETDSITQIAALSEDKSFDVYVKPTCRIGKWARENTHLIFDTKKGQMYYKNKKVHSKKPEKALRDFLSYLREYGEPVILVAHNCHGFDAAFLYNQLKKYNSWEEFVDLVKGFADTLPMFRHVHPGMRSYELETLASKYLEDSREKHNGIDDTKTLKTLVENNGNIDHLVKYFRDCSEMERYLKTRPLRKQKGTIKQDFDDDSDNFTEGWEYFDGV